MSVRAIQSRIADARAKIKAGTKLNEETNTLVVSLQFEDEHELAQLWMQSVADCKFLLEEFAEAL